MVYVEQIAQEVGIDPGMVEQAATELDQERSRTARATPSRCQYMSAR